MKFLVASNWVATIIPIIQYIYVFAKPIGKNRLSSSKKVQTVISSAEHTEWWGSFVFNNSFTIEKKRWFTARQLKLQLLVIN